jgi:hypothetical protein
MPNDVTDLTVVPRPHQTRSSEGLDHTIELPSKQSVRRHAIKYALEVVIAPSVIFYTMFVNFGLKPALLAALAWSSTAVIRRVVKGERVPATLALSMTMLLARTAVAWLSGSVFLYFLQPALTTFLTAGVLLGSVVIKKPFAAKALQDYVPALPTDWTTYPHMLRFFNGCSLMWGGMYLISASINTWALMSTSLGPFMIISKAGGTTMAATCVLISIFWGLRSLRRDGVHVVFAQGTSRRRTAHTPHLPHLPALPVVVPAALPAAA